MINVLILVVCSKNWKTKQSKKILKSPLGPELDLHRHRDQNPDNTYQMR